MSRLPDIWRCGINLGNSLDCFDDHSVATETTWNNPVITREMVQMYADAGFSMLRLPVTWDDHFSKGPDAVIDPEWMARVRQVVEWGIDAGMTVMLNAHHEFRWLKPELSRLWEILPRYQKLWHQIALEFRDFGDELILQGTNEPNLQHGENCDSGSGNRNVRASINAINHTFVRTVRETGGNNATRWLCIPNLAARPLPECMKDMILPKDDHLIYTIHSYVPDRFIFSRHDRQDTAFFDEKARDEVMEMFEDIKRYALSQGAPVMMTEFGAVAKKLPGTDRWNDEERLKFVRCFLDRARELDIPCFWWDNNYLGSGDEYFQLFDRSSLTCTFPEIARELVTNCRGTK